MHISDIMNSINLLLPNTRRMLFMLIPGLRPCLGIIMMTDYCCQWVYIYVCISVCGLDSLFSSFQSNIPSPSLSSFLCLAHVPAVLLMCAKCAVKDVVCHII